MRLPQVHEEPEAGPLWVPPAWFLAAVLWLAGTSVGLLRVAPDLAQGLVYHPRVFAVTHAVALGVITSAIFGALHQFVPAVLGVGPRSPAAAVAGLGSFQAGVLLLVWAFLRWSPAGQGLAWILILLGVGGASWNILPARRRAIRNRYVGTYVTLGHSALGLAMLLAAVRIGNGLGWWHTSREGMLAAHFHLGALGLGTLTAVGFGSKMLPAFLGTRDVPTASLSWIGWMVSAGLLLFSVGTVGRIFPAYAAGGVLMICGAAAHLHLIGSYFLGRTQPLDPGLGFVLVAATCYAGVLVVGSVMLVVRPGPVSAWGAYAILSLLGWLALFIIGVMHRVVPRVLTLIRVRRGGALTPVHQRVELVSAPLAWASLALLGVGTVGLALSVGMGSTGGAQVAAITFLAGVACLMVQSVRVARAALG